MKLFATQGVAIVPSAWIKAMDPTSTRVQANVFVYAENKADAGALLVEGGLTFVTAANIVRQLKLNRSNNIGGVRELVEAGIVDPEQRSAFAYSEGNADDAVISLTDPALPVIAHFRYRTASETLQTSLPVGIYAEPVKAEDAGRITWTATPYNGWTGKINGLTVAKISWGTDRSNPGYSLRMELPGFKDANGLDEADAKALAERRVESFVKHLGAAFPEASK